MSLNPEKTALTKMLLETGQRSFVRDGLVRLPDSQVYLQGFKDPEIVTVQLFGDDYKVLAPDSGLRTDEYKHTNATVLLESGLPVIAFVQQEFRNGREEPETQLIAVNVHEPRRSVFVKGRSNDLHILENHGWIDGGLNLPFYCSGFAEQFDLQTFQVAKAHGNYVLSLAE